MNWLRRLILEMWAFLILSGIVGFLGPFGSYGSGDFIDRTWHWSLMLLGAYGLVRPVIILCRWLERLTHLPRNFVVLLGTLGFAVPLAAFWFVVAPRETRPLESFSALVPFTLLCSLAVYFVAWWAERADAQIRDYLARNLDAPLVPAAVASAQVSVPAVPEVAAMPAGFAAGGQPRLRARLSRGFEGEIIALESEDHYVRVHGPTRNELLLLRLREAILEMDGVPGEQTHRSWWVARSAVAQVVSHGRNRELRLVNGLRVPVARDSIPRLRASGFLPE